MLTSYKFCASANPDLPEASAGIQVEAERVVPTWKVYLPLALKGPEII
jgi:hypothetical protein